MIDSFDHYLVGLMSYWAQQSVLLNKIIIQLLSLDTFKTLPLFALLWLLWFSVDETENRRAILEGFVAMFLAGALSRAIQDALPERVRPLHAGDPAFIPPLGITPEDTVLEHWSSFPSDHAAVYFALSTALWLLSKRLGLAAYTWSLLVICMPRIFAGYHYASDVIGGAVIGVVVASFIAPIIAGKLGPFVWAAEKRSRGPFYAGFFVLSFQFLTMFNDLRIAASALKKFI